jgi:hypothetical protein
MTTQTIPTARKPACKLAFHVQRAPCFLCVAIKGEASFDQAEFISAQLLRLPLKGSSLVVLDLAELTFISALAIGAADATGRNGSGIAAERHGMISALAVLRRGKLLYREMLAPVLARCRLKR